MPIDTEQWKASSGLFCASQHVLLQSPRYKLPKPKVKAESDTLSLNIKFSTAVLLVTLRTVVFYTTQALQLVWLILLVTLCSYTVISCPIELQEAERCLCLACSVPCGHADDTACVCQEMWRRILDLQRHEVGDPDIHGDHFTNIKINFNLNSSKQSMIIVHSTVVHEPATINQQQLE